MHYICVDVQRQGEVVRALELDYRWLGATYVGSGNHKLVSGRARGAISY